MQHRTTPAPAAVAFNLWLFCRVQQRLAFRPLLTLPGVRRLLLWVANVVARMRWARKGGGTATEIHKQANTNHELPHRLARAWGDRGQWRRLQRRHGKFAFAGGGQHQASTHLRTNLELRLERVHGAKKHLRTRAHKVRRQCHVESRWSAAPFANHSR